MRKFRAVAVALLVCALSGALLRGDGLDGYTRHVWQASDGLPEQTVQAFAQTPDGYLWIGTTGGLLRFDGAHFTLFDRQNTPELRENSIFCLMTAHDDALWIGTEGGGLARYANGRFRSWDTRNGLSNDFVRSIVKDARGTIWAGTDNGLLRLQGDRFVRVDNGGGSAGVPALAVHALYQDRAGNLWVGGSRLLRLTGTSVREYTMRGVASQNRVKSIVQTTDGTMWVGTVSGLYRMLPGQDRFQRVPGISGTVRVLRQTPDGVLWIGTIGQGAFEWSAGRLMRIAAPSDLPSNTVLNFFEDSEKNFWIGTQAGMVRLTRAQVRIVALPQENDSDFGTIYQDSDGSFWIGSTLLFQMKNDVLTAETLPGLGGVHVRSVYRERAGALWVGTDGDGVFRIKGGRTQGWTTRDGMSNNFVRAMTEDRDGSMWVTTDDGLNHLLPERGGMRIVSYEMRNGLAYFSTRALLEDRDGDLWIGTDHGLSHMHAGAFVHDPATAALAQMKIWAIYQDSTGSIWFGTRNSGLYRFRAGKLAHYTTADGLASNAIYQILGDEVGHLWMSGPNGISLLKRSELDAQADAPQRHLALTFYSIADMAANTEIYGGTQPSGCITASGDVWFPSNRGPIHVPRFQTSLLPPPPLRIQSVLADGQPAPLPGPVVLPPGNGRLEFVFAPIQLRSQDGLRFRYRLEGFDKNWSASSTARTADYTNLPPDRYRFRVQVFEVGNPGAVHEVSIEIVQRPFFYRTPWFIAICTLLTGLLIFAAYQYRVRQVRARFEAVLDERSRLAREMHDTVIQGCTGVSALLEALSMKDTNPTDGADPTGDRAGESGLMDFARLQLRSTINEAREAIWNLRQPDGDPGSLNKKLESMSAQAGKEFRMAIHYALDGVPFGVSHPMAHDLLMVAREAVSNAALHGSPTRIDVSLAYNHRELLLAVADNGHGFNPEQMEAPSGHHFGIKGMKERVERWGGKFCLTSSSGKGVRIEARVPRPR